MKTLELLQNLPLGTRKKLEFVIKSHPRASLVRLFDFLAGRTEPPPKAELYLAAFQTEYTPAKDYLLRNELRLLTNEIEEVIAGQVFEKTFRQDANFRRLWTEKAYMELARYAPTDPVPDPLPDKDFAYDQVGYWADLMELWLKKNIETGEMDATQVEDLIAGAEKLIRMRQADAARKLAQASLILGAARRWGRSNADEPQPAPEVFDLRARREADPVAAFLHGQFLAQSARGKEKIALLETALAHLRRCAESRLFDRMGKEMRLLAAIALEWYLLGAYEEADRNYAQALSLQPGKHHPLNMAIAVNYFDNLLKAGQYARAIAVAASWQDLFVDNPQAHFPFLALKAMAYLFLDEPRKALACIPPDIQQRPGNTYILFRFVQVIAYGVRGDWEAAEREAANVAKMLRYWKKNERKRVRELELDYLVIALWLERYFQASSLVKDAALQAQAQLFHEIDAHPAQQNPVFRDYLPLKWLYCKGEKIGLTLPIQKPQ